jgi:hypothetical protein
MALSNQSGRSRTGDRQMAQIGLSIFRFARQDTRSDKAGDYMAEFKGQKKEQTPELFTRLPFVCGSIARSSCFMLQQRAEHVRVERRRIRLLPAYNGAYELRFRNCTAGAPLVPFWPGGSHGPFRRPWMPFRALRPAT